MKVLEFDVHGLLGRLDIALRLNPDLNIITGRNGSGKTTALKLLWYMVSGNILVALREVAFKRARVKTDQYEYTVYRTGDATCRIEWVDNDGKRTFEDERDIDGDTVLNAEDPAEEMLFELGSSIFFPTFRRIEGGFTMTSRAAFGGVARTKNEIEESLVALSKKLSRGKHVFVASLSTVDIVNLLVRQYTNLSDEYNLFQQSASQKIIEKIRRFTASNPDDSHAVGVLQEVRLEIEGIEKSRDRIMRPLEAVRELAGTLFKSFGIKLAKNLSFGDAANAVNSDLLSAGEKQMLSFIAYNAFHGHSVFLIDEPELSLHVDWQRQLFPILLNQQSSNQFIIATHSPFIYSKYPDKEIRANDDRGEAHNTL